MLEITARLADGWVPESRTPRTYESTLGKLREKMRELGREPEELESCLALISYPFEPDGGAYGRLLAAARLRIPTSSGRPAREVGTQVSGPTESS